jgi:hypothetical protein
MLRSSIMTRLRRVAKLKFRTPKDLLNRAIVGRETTMKLLLSMLFLCLTLGVSCANTVEQSTQKLSQQPGEPMKTEHPLLLESVLLQPGYTFFTVMEAKKPIADHTYLLARSPQTEVKIQDTAGFTQVLKGIASPDDALVFVRLLTSQEVRPFLRDVYYTEVHQQAGSDDVWFAIEPARYAALQLHDPIATAEKNGIYKIERFVACYPRILLGKIVTDARLVKIREWVAPDGQYAAEIMNTIAEGEAIQRILIFTK